MTFQKLDLKAVDWQVTLPRLGIDAAALENPRRLGPCPIEGEGATRFRFVNQDGRGNWFCNNCGAGDAIKLIALVHGITDAAAIRMVRDLDSSSTLKGPPKRLKPLVPTVDKARAKAVLQRVWNECKPVFRTPAEAYILRRVPGFDMAWLASSIAFHPELYHKDDPSNKTSLYPAMVARVTGLDNRPVTLHRTYLSPDGFKAPVSPDQVKKLMTGVTTLAGHSIRLNQPRVKTRVAIVCEGIETGLALVAATKNRHCVFSALNAGNLSKFSIAKIDFDMVIICADKDVMNKKHGWRPGEHFAEILQSKLIAEGFSVKFRVPEVEGKDFADLWMETYKLKLAA